MLPPFIIEQIRKREEEERRHRPQPAIELPLPETRAPRRPPEADEERDRGVVIIDLRG